jgi:tRNA A-37 threonylcarbamoyl transferase component Bud32
VPGYEIIRELGRGGMGIVYQARQIKLNRLVALKMILVAEYAGPEERARFQTEAEAVACLQHPNIVQIYEVGEQAGRPFFSMEFCASGSLEKKLGGVPLPPQEAAHLAETLARAMHATHEAGVVHRDLKPANVLLAKDGTPKVTDFGLAKKLDEVGQTATGAVMGTPSYMAPEQAGGKSKEVGPHTDVYAMGAILYELLTGRPPFRAATALDTILQVVSDEPVPPSRLQRGIPHDLETICLKCLEKDPRRRYSTAQELAADLDRFHNDEPIRAQRPRFWTHLRLWLRRPERVRDAGIVTILGAITTVPTLLAQCYTFVKSTQLELFRYLGVASLATLGVGVLGIVLRLWLGFKMVRRRAWAIWMALVLNLVTVGVLVARDVMVARSVTDRTYREAADTTQLYVNMVQSFLLASVPVFACCIALYAWYCNRDTFKGTRSSAGARVAAVGGLVLLAAASYLSAVFDHDRRFPDVNRVGGTVLVYEVEEVGGRPDLVTMDKLATTLQHALQNGGHSHVRIRPLNDRRLEVGLPRTRPNHAESVQEIKKLMLLDFSRAIGLKFVILANQDDDREGMEVAQRYFDTLTEEKKQDLARAAVNEVAPPTPRPPDGKGFNITLGNHTATVNYSWIEMGPTERHLYGLINDQEHSLFWKEMAEARKSHKAVIHTGFGQYRTHLFYSREVINRDRLPENDRDKKYEYFILCRDPERDEDGKPKAVTGDDLVRAYPTEDASRGGMAVGFTLNNEGARLLGDLTSANKGREMAIVLDDIIQSAPNIETPVTGGNGIIAGNYTAEDVDRLVTMLGVGALPLRLKREPVRESTLPARYW